MDESQFINAVPLPGSEKPSNDAGEAKFVNAVPLPNEQKAAPAPSQEPQRGFVDKYLVPVGQGLGDVVRTAENVFNKSLLGRATAPVRQWLSNELEGSGNRVAQALGATIGQSPQQENQLYQENEQGNSAAPYLRMAGQVATTAPMVAAAPEMAESVLPESAMNLLTKGGPLARFVARGLTGGLQGMGAAGMLSSASKQPLSTQLEEGAAGGAFFNAIGGPAIGKVGDFVGGLAKRIFGAGGKILAGEGEGSTAAFASNPQEGESVLMQAFADQGVKPGQLTPNIQENLAQEAQKQLETSGAVNPMALARSANIQKWGFKPFRAAISRDPSDWADMDAIRKTPPGGKIAQMFSDNNFQAAKDLETLKNSMGGVSENAGEAAASASDFAFAKSKAWQKQVGALYKDIEDRFGSDVGAAPNDLLEASDNVGAMRPGMQSWLSKRLQKFGVIDKEGESTGKELTISQANTLRKQIGELPGSDPTDRWAKNQLIDALDNDILDTAGGDEFAPARAEAKARFAQVRDEGIVQSILERRGNPDTLIERLFIGKGGKAASAQALEKAKTFFTTGPDGNPSQEGEQVWNEFRRQVMGWIQNQAKATVHGGVSEETAGELGNVSVAGYHRALERIGPQKLEILFGKDHADELMSFGKALKDVLSPVAQAPINPSGTAGALFRLNELAGEPIGFRALTHPVGAGVHLLGKGAAYLAKRGEIARTLAPTAVKPVETTASKLTKATLPAWWSAAGTQEQNP